MTDIHHHRHLPHFHSPGYIQDITFRLYDGMPLALRSEWDQPGLSLQQDNSRIQEYLDAGRGSCLLRDEKAAEIVEQTLLHDDKNKYYLLAWAIMPNHVHVLVRFMPGISMASILNDWKKFSAIAVNKAIQRSGLLWQRDYFDCFIRHERHLLNSVQYIHNNPVMAGLVENAGDWRYSSAGRVATIDSTFHSPFDEDDYTS